MSRQRIAVVIGTRPEAIKMAPVVLALRATKRVDLWIVATGQHGEMLRDALAGFGLAPDVDLALMRPGQSLQALAGRILTALEAPLDAIRPDVVLVHGDTITGFAGALASFYRGTPCVHVEAGMRSHRLDSPFPEEFHRTMIAKMATHHFAATAQAACNLVAEGVDPACITVTGSTAVDAATEVLRRLGAPARPERLVVVTAHRRESQGEGLTGVMRAVGELARRFPGHRFVLPAHPSPAVRRAIAEGLPALPNLEVTEPMPYSEFLPLMARAELILTDSGGIQEEAAYLGRPVLLLRDATERPEAVATGLVRLVGCDPEAIVRMAARHLSGRATLAAAPTADNPFAMAGASRRIAAELVAGAYARAVAA